jgi:predicted SnoaL-like aldol condensation-catalyzing enzyme
MRTIEDGQYVFLHIYLSLSDREAEWVVADFFDTDENDKLVEHWDVISEYAPRTPSGHTSIDGANEHADLDKTEENKQVVRDLIADVLVGENPGNIDNYISSVEYVQHDAEVPDGLEHFKRLALDDERPLVYEEIVLLVGQGNFVAALCKALWEGQPVTRVDVFRLEDGKVVEHWDSVEPFPPRKEWVDSGRF